MIPSTLKATLVIGIIIYIIIILMFLKNKAIALKYTLLWLAAGMVLGIMVIWPESLGWFVKFLGITSTMNGLFVTCIAFVIMILMSLTSIVSKQADRIKTLTQTIAKIEKRLREVELGEE